VYYSCRLDAEQDKQKRPKDKRKQKKKESKQARKDDSGDKPG